MWATVDASQSHGCHCVSNRLQLDYFSNRLLKPASKETSKTGIARGMTSHVGPSCGKRFHGMMSSLVSSVEARSDVALNSKMQWFLVHIPTNINSLLITKKEKLFVIKYFLSNLTRDSKQSLVKLIHCRLRHYGGWINIDYMMDRHLPRARWPKAEWLSKPHAPTFHCNYYGRAEGPLRVVENRNLLSHPDDLRVEAYVIRTT